MHKRNKFFTIRPIANVASIELPSTVHISAAIWCQCAGTLETAINELTTDTPVKLLNIPQFAKFSCIKHDSA